MQQAPVRLVERFYYDLWNTANEAVAWEILHPAFQFRASLGPEKIGPGGFIEYMRLIHTALSGYECTIQEMLESGERVAARLRFSGVHHAMFFGIPPTGREIVWSGAAFFRITGHRIVSLWVLGDVGAVKRQLGAASTTSGPQGPRTGSVIPAADTVGVIGERLRVAFRSAGVDDLAQFVKRRRRNAKIELDPENRTVG